MSASLPAEDAGHEAHDEAAGPLDPRDEITLHHWMMLSAIRAGNGEAAQAHGTQIIDLVGGEHQAAMRDAVRAIDAGELSDAQAAVIEMLAGFEPDITDSQILLRLALQALVTGDADEAIADLEAVLRSGDGEAMADVEQAIEAIRRGELEEAQELIEPLTGLPEHEDNEEHD